ncbi:ATP-binding protein [Dactylosporangium sp. NPDC051541]|uniref:ATP-binding protein n=1 Tax=Dactylosporangium sp. NPDC051541 TaxID=3363977 RepID=UPI0037BBB9FA
MSSGLDHLAVFYDGLADLALTLRRFAGARVVLACGPAQNRVLAAVLPGAVTRPAVVPGTRPAGAIAEYRKICRDRGADGERLVIVGQPRYSRTAADWRNTGIFEAACNVTLARRPVTVVCAYPADCPPAIREQVLRAHPHLLTADGPAANAECRDPEILLGLLSPSVPWPAPGGASLLRVSRSTGLHDLSDIRSALSAALLHLPTLTRADFVAAVNELLTNAYQHGEPPLDLALWSDRGHVDCRITDRGRGLTDALAGYRPDEPTNPARAGFGLWLARQASDRIDMWRDQDGFTVRAVTAVPTTKVLPTSGARARAEAARTRLVRINRRFGLAG